MSDKAYYITQGLIITALVMLSMTATGCDAIFGIFKAGIWVGVIVVVVLVGIVGMIIRSMKS